MTERRFTTRSKRLVLVSLTLIALLLVLAAAEVAVRVRQQLKYGSAVILENLYTVDPKINLRVPIANFSNGRITVNSFGFRGPEIPASKQPGTVRLAFLGASTTWCAEVSGNEHVWPHLVAKSLARAYAGVAFDYVNAGVPGYTLGAMLKSLEHRVAPLQPDVVIVYDASNNLSGELRERAAKQGLVESAQFRQFSWPSGYSLLWNLAEKNLRVLKAQRDSRRDAARLATDPSTLGREYQEELTGLVRSAQRHAKVVALVTFSIHPRREQPLEMQLRASSSAFVYMPFASPRLVIDAFERYNEIVREVARDTGALLIEGEHEIPGDSLHFTDTVHFTDLGSQAMAQRVARALISSREMRELLSSDMVRG